MAYELSSEEQKAIDKQSFLSKLLWIIPAFLIWFQKVFVFRYTFPNAKELLQEIDLVLEKNKGRPLLIVANHMTMYDSLIYVYKASMRHKTKFYPWHIPDAHNFDPETYSFFMKMWWKLFLYLGRCIPVARKGKVDRPGIEPEVVWAKIASRFKAKEAVFLFPETTRDRSGWVDKYNLNTFAGDLISANPDLGVLLIYGRANDQVSYTYSSKPKSIYRMYTDYFVVSEVEEATNNPVFWSRLVFDKLYKLQSKWFENANLSGLPIKRCCLGNDIIDLKCSGVKSSFYLDNGDPLLNVNWLQKRLTEQELCELYTKLASFLLEEDELPCEDTEETEDLIDILSEQERDLTLSELKLLLGIGEQTVGLKCVSEIPSEEYEKIFLNYWKHHSGKESAYKALVQSNLPALEGDDGFCDLEVNTFKGIVTQLSTGIVVKLRYEITSDYIHCIGMYRGGSCGDDFIPTDIHMSVKDISQEEDLSSSLREDLACDEVLAAYPFLMGVLLAHKKAQSRAPELFYAQHYLDIGLSDSDSGRFIAIAFIKLEDDLIKSQLRMNEVKKPKDLLVLRQQTQI